MDKAAAIKLSKDLQAVLDQHGVTGFTFKVGGATYSANEVTFKVTAEVAGTAPVRHLQWNAYGHFYGLKPEALGQQITIKGRVFTIDGLKTSTRARNNVHLLDANGREFLTDPETVKRALASV